MRLIRKYGPRGPRLFEEVWELLGKYTFVVNAELRRRGLPQKGQLELMGAICSHFLLATQSRILDEYQATIGGISIDYYSSHIAATPRDAATAVLSNVRRAGGRGPGATGNAAHEEVAGPVRWYPRGPNPLDRRLPKASGKVRARGTRLTRAVDAREQIRRATNEG